MSNVQKIDAAALLATLEEGLSSPAASALRAFVMRKDRKSAMDIIMDEADFTKDECAALYKHLSKMLQGKDVCFVEVPKTEWAALVESIPEYETITDMRQQVSFLVRYQCDIINTQPFKHRGETVIYTNRSESVPFLKLDQIWRIVNK